MTRKPTMSVLIDKSVCPHASGQQTAMHVCVMSAVGGRGRGPRQPAPAPHPWRPHPTPVLITHMHGCPLSRCMRTDRLVDEDGHGDFDLPHTGHIRQYKGSLTSYKLCLLTFLHICSNMKLTIFHICQESFKTIKTLKTHSPS